MDTHVETPRSRLEPGGGGRWELEFRAVTSVFGKLSAQKDAKPGFKWTPS